MICVVICFRLFYCVVLFVSIMKCMLCMLVVCSCFSFVFGMLIGNVVMLCVCGLNVVSVVSVYWLLVL